MKTEAVIEWIKKYKILLLVLALVLIGGILALVFNWYASISVSPFLAWIFSKFKAQEILPLPSKLQQETSKATTIAEKVKKDFKQETSEPTIADEIKKEITTTNTTKKTTNDLQRWITVGDNDSEKDS